MTPARDGLVAVALSGAQHSALTRFFLTVRPLRARPTWRLHTKHGHRGPHGHHGHTTSEMAGKRIFSGQEEKKKEHSACFTLQDEFP